LRVERARRDRRGQRHPPPPTFTSVLSLASSAEVALSVFFICSFHYFISQLERTALQESAKALVVGLSRAADELAGARDGGGV